MICSMAVVMVDSDGAGLLLWGFHIPYDSVGKTYYVAAVEGFAGVMLQSLSSLKR